MPVALSSYLQNGAFGVIENSRRCSFGYDQRVEVFGAGGSIQGANRSPQDVLVNNEEGLNSGEKRLMCEQYRHLLYDVCVCVLCFVFW